MAREWPDYADDFPKEVKSCVGSGDGTFLVVIGDGQVIGLGGIQISLMSYAVWNITWLLVDPEYRGKGIGGMLVRKLEDYAKEHRDSRENELAICLTTGVASFYEKLGYKAVVEYSGRGNKTRYLMWRTL